MSSKIMRLVYQPFPALPQGLSLEVREWLTVLESHLASNNYSRILVKMESGLNASFFLVFMDRLLRFTKTRNILLLASASSKPALISAWKDASLLEGDQRLSERYHTSYSPRVPLARGTRVCISTLREMQLCFQHSRRLSRVFRMVLAYDVPATPSPVWQQVVDSFGTSYLIGFCRALTPEVSEWFGGNVISMERSPLGESGYEPETPPSDISVMKWIWFAPSPLSIPPGYAIEARAERLPFASMIP